MSILQYEPGEIVTTLCGRDAGKLYIILGGNDRMLQLTDGKYHSVTNPKKKNRKHVQLIHEKNCEVVAKLEAGTLRDEDVKYALSQYRRKVQQAGSAATKASED